MTGPKRIRWYFWAAAVVLMAGGGMFVVSYYDTDYDPSVPPSLFDYAQMVVFALVPSALFGLAAPSVKPSRVRSYFGWAALIGLIGTYGGYRVLLLSHLGCNDSCVPSVPTYTAISWMSLVALVLAAIVPGVLALAPLGLDRAHHFRAGHADPSVELDE